MANPLRGEVALPVSGPDGAPRVLCFDVNRLCDLEAMFGGRSSSDLAAKINTGSMTILRGFLWAGLRDQVPLAEAGKIAFEIGPLVLGPKILEAMAAAFPVADVAEASDEGGEGGEPGQDPPKAA